MKNYVDKDKLQEFATKLHNKQKTIFAPIEAVGSPLTAATVAEMTDETKVYVYTGSETGYTSGNWYYYDGSAWTSGGVYNSAAVDVDTTLSISGKPADAKATGDKITDLTTALDYTTTRTDITPEKEHGGFSGNVGEEITFNTTTQWERISFISEPDTTYIITFSTRANISTRYYIYTVNNNNIILNQYANVNTYSERQILTVELSFDPSVTVWVLSEYTKTLKVEKLTSSSAIEILQSDVATLEQAVFPETSDYDKGPYNTIKEDFADYYIGLNTDYTAFNANTTYAEVITAFDALMALDTAHITKTALGTASGTDANSDPYTIYEYEFAPYTYSGALTLAKNPLILLDAGIHGFEKNSVYGLYYFLHDIVTKYADNPVLTAIHNNVKIKIIPVSNPHGFDNDRYYNANNVNINRNFGTSDWTSIIDSQTSNSGLAPFDQPESAIIRDWIYANLNNITAYFNIHTNGRVVHSYQDMNSCMPKFERTNNDSYFARLANVVQRHIQRQTAILPKENNLTIPANAFIGKYQTETGSAGTASIWAAEQAKIASMTFELFIKLTVNDVVIIDSYAEKSKKLCSEMIGNIIAETILEYSE